jgi:hypothetical protein
MNGEAILDALRQTDIMNNIYFDKSRDYVGANIDDKLDADGQLRIEAARRKLYGVWTQGKSRDTMFSLLDTHVKEYKDKFITHNIIDDILKLVKTKRGKIEASSGFHDDSIMSYLISLYVYYHGNNLVRFGFVKGELPDEEHANKGLTYEELYEELPDQLKQQFENFSVKTQDDYTTKIKDEIMRARKEMQQIDVLLNPVDRAENFDDPFTEGDIDLNFFDDLNS